MAHAGVGDAVTDPNRVNIALGGTFGGRLSTPLPSVPVVLRFSLPKLMAPLESVMLPLARVRLPIAEPRGGGEHAAPSVLGAQVFVANS